MRNLLCLLIGLVALPNPGWTAEIVKSVHGFSDVNFEVIEGTKSDSRFRLGEYDTYVTGTLDERTSYLSEVTFKYANSNTGVLGLERFWVRYEFTPQVNVSFGKFHSAVGSWNRTYHHGSLLFPSIDKPATRSYFPIHTTGVLVSGREITSARLYYDLMIGNGSGTTPTSDNDDGKSVNLSVHTQAIEDVDLGLSIYKENIAAGAGEGSLSAAEDMSLLMLSPSINLRSGSVMLEAEVLLATTEGDDSKIDNTTKAAYVLAAKDVGNWTPFVKFDYAKVDASDVYYKVADSKLYSVGVNYHLSHLAVTKLQLRRTSQAGGSSSKALLSQIAIAF